MSHDHGPHFVHTHDGSTHSHPVRAPRDLGPAPRLHLRGVVLPQGETLDLWVRDGVISLEPVADAQTVSTGGWILPGLVDAHCHVGLNADGPVDDEAAEIQALTDRDAGTLLIRDAGSPSDTRWVDDRDDLPRIIRAGRHIARPKRYTRNYAAEIEPADLVAEVTRQALRGDGWVKLVGDWIDRDLGDLAPLWPVETAREAIDAAHALGVRVTAHCFGEQSAGELVEAGIDGIEHGPGIEDATIEAMAARGVALVPTLINIERFEEFARAGEEKFPAYAAHMRSLWAGHRAVLRKAREAGVPIYAGTDAGGGISHGLIGREILALGDIGDAEFALSAASWRARSWLGVPGLSEGSPADLVVYDADPRTDLAVTLHPSLILLRGRVYA